MEIDRYCNSCLGYYSYDIDETDHYENVVGVDQKILKKPEVKGLPMLFSLLMLIWKREFSTLNQ